MFTYDANGNLTHDGRKDLDIQWNIFNLASGAVTHDGSLTYARLSDGTLVSSQNTSGNSTTGKRYCGSFVFTTGTGVTAPLVESVAWDEGRIFRDALTGTYQDCWFAGDHLGNVRSVVDISPNLSSPVVLEQNDYLPYGMKIVNPQHVQMSANRWRYAWKEEFPEVNLMDFGARLYDSFTARWITDDPLARRYTIMSPNMYCAGNPVNMVDPEGKWIKTAEGVLEAEKGDNAWSLAVYLNTSPEIAIQLLSDQGYIVNEKGILNLKVGNTFVYNVYTEDSVQRQSLGLLGDKIRSYLSSDFSKDLFDNYWMGKGDLQLSGKDFVGILMYLKDNDISPSGSDVVLIGESERRYSGAKAEIKLYGSPNYALALGTATVYMNSKGQIVGFYDRYDFNSLPPKARSIKNELKTRMVRLASPSGAKAYDIRYGFKAE